MKVNITVVATKTFTAGFVPSGAVAMLPIIAIKSYEVNPLKIAQAANQRGDASWDPPAVRRLNHREHRVTQGMTQTTSTEILRFSCETLCPLRLLRFLFRSEE